MSDSEDQPVEIEPYEEIADELVRHSTLCYERAV